MTHTLASVTGRTKPAPTREHDHALGRLHSPKRADGRRSGCKVRTQRQIGISMTAVARENLAARVSEMAIRARRLSCRSTLAVTQRSEFRRGAYFADDERYGLNDDEVTCGHVAECV